MLNRGLKIQFLPGAPIFSNKNNFSQRKAKMKFRVTFKTPDVVDNTIENLGVEPDEQEAIYKQVVSKWFKYGEYVTIEVDTNADTATVVEN